MLFRRTPLLAAALIISGSLAALAVEPATQPVEQQQQQEPQEEKAPTTLPSQSSGKPASEASLQTGFNDLAASDAAVRERAYSALLGLTRDDLPALHRIVERNRPVAPSQRGALREIVTHVYLSGEPYPGEVRSGFLGLLMPMLDSVEVRRPEQPDEFTINDNAGEAGLRPAPSTGVPIEYRIPGFCAFRALREGDVILSIVRPMPKRLHEWNDLSPTIRRFRAGDTITFEVLRQGKVLEVPVTLDALPLVATENAWMSEILPARDAAAEEYWNTHFAGLVEDRASASIPHPDAHASTATGEE